MTDIYQKLAIPEPSADLENRIISAAHTKIVTEGKYNFPRLAMVAACIMITLSVIKTDDSQLVTKKNMLADINFFSDQYGFTGDIS